MEEYVKVHPEEARFLEELKEVSKKGHRADAVRYVERDKQWTYVENSGHKRIFKVG